MEAAGETIWLDMACKVINGYVSNDTALYSTLWVISRGENVLLNALKDPDSLAELDSIPFGEAECEMLMAIGFNGEDFHLEEMEAIHQKWLEEIVPAIAFRNNEKYGAYDRFEDAMADIPNVLPHLLRRAEQAGFDWENFI
ncbi:DUF4240 domain-containing protein [Oxalobacter vibrioformis]|uniref:DUF4240 domain-containing protein n=1 Tax=Oxalobacter vibrioformis TaxID=933080 RepID=A0A9E9LYY2_9BURK|nr:DUF4240 domain-containing protein [Oxalobacter vibrioformis]WAW09473.1 DUF4240 domain-containing protein [Oxalobacter vibrioformis]